ncbi:PDZ domain-containing protein [Exiguobacterium artemiae]|uniref:PDZ domain-containing protein n=1 Tax=Exiguobacterium artemiae TaxID=340145 RepID=UPI0029642660|nr:PDZ domain-containing protein [Exiguobacterium sibiricum]MDW2884355.1 PDZ domain-containing protein [Exiguobacterium sibiricum]
MGVELLDGIGWTVISLFASPILWLAVLVSFLLSMRRVKRERNLFRSRTRSKRTDLFETLVPGFVVGLVLSVISVSLTLTVSTEFLIAFMVLTFLILLTGVIRFNLPLGPLVLLAGVTWFMTGDRVDSLRDVTVSDWLLLAALSLGAELVLLIWRGKKNLSPSLVLSKRGRYIGGLSSNKLWLIPLVVFVPGSSLETLIPQWSFPEFVPIVMFLPIGFSFLFTGQLPDQLIRPLIQGRLLTFGLSVVLAVGAFLTGQAAWLYGLPVLLIVHLILHQRIKRLNRSQTPLFLNGKRGVVILGTLPEKPASEMGLVPGEAIYKVNGEFVESEKSFYEAIQKHKPYLRLEVMNHNGDVRFAQRAFYEQDHHDLGILFVSEPGNKRTKIRTLQ